MSFEMSYAGIPFVVDNEISRHLQRDGMSDRRELRDADAKDDVLQHLVRGCQALEDTRIITPYPTARGPSYIAQPYHHIARPKLKPGMFYYPTGASRWAEYHGLVTSAQLAGMKAAAFPGGIPTRNWFKMAQGGNVIQTPMIFLSARPVASFAGNPGLFLVTLVDERYFFQYAPMPVPNINPDTTWESLMTDCSGALQISLQLDTISTNYPEPEIDSDLNLQYENAAILLDACAYNTGTTIVRRFDGTYKAMLHANSIAQSQANKADITAWLAGGNAFDATTVNAILPGAVTVAYPAFRTDEFAYVRANSAMIPQPRTTGDYYSYTVQLDELGLGLQGIGGYTKTFINTCKAVFAGEDLPVNLDILEALSFQIALDYYASTSSGFDQTVPGVFEWIPEGLHDILAYWQGDRVYTRIQGKPYNFGVEYLQHRAPVGMIPDKPPEVCTKVITDVSCVDGFLYTAYQYFKIPITTGAYLTDLPCSSMSSSSSFTIPDIFSEE
jgi:hypothetical protein